MIKAYRLAAIIEYSHATCCGQDVVTPQYFHHSVHLSVMCIFTKFGRHVSREERMRH